MPKPKQSAQPIELATVSRTEIKPHPSNPRSMTPEARSKLDRGLKRFGMLAPVLANRRTGNVLGGHQRLAWLDRQNKSPDYTLQVCWCDVPEKDELTILALLNQPNAQGEWDVDALAGLLQAGDIDVELAGFERVDLELLLPDIDTSGLFSSTPPGVEKTREEMERVAEVNKAQRKGEGAGIAGERDTEFYAVVVFKDRDEKANFLQRLGLPGDERYLASSALMSYLPTKRLAGKKPPSNGSGRPRRSAAPSKSGACG